MKKKNTLSGLVVVVVLLSGTTALYFLGVQRPGVTQVLARPLGSDDCSVGAFCAKRADQTTGCTSVGCCPQGQTYCNAQAREGFPFPKLVGIKAGEKGQCWTFTGEVVDYCMYYQCGDAALCSDSSCKEIATIRIATQQYPIGSGVCPIDDK